MLTEVVVFASGFGMGAIPSILSYYMMKKDLYADWVLGTMTGEVATANQQGEYVPNFKQEKRISIGEMAKAIVHHAELYPEKWQVFTETKPTYKGSNAYFGVINTEANISVLRNNLTFSRAEDIYLNDVKLDVSTFKYIVNGVTKSKDDENMRNIFGRLNPPPQNLALANKNNEELKKLSDYTSSKKEAVGKTVDPFAETYNDQIYKIGKARASLEKKSRKSTNTKAKTRYVIYG